MIGASLTLQPAHLIRAAGGLVWRPGGSTPRLAVVRRTRSGEWVLPKGKLEDGESFPVAALREVAEETGCRVRLREFAGYVLYEAGARRKLALFWHMLADDAPAFRPNHEIDAVAWLPPREALARLARPAERELVETAIVDGLGAAPRGNR